MIDGIVGTCTDQCGVGRFNRELARRLGIQVGPLEAFKLPLVSVKPSEVSFERLTVLESELRYHVWRDARGEEFNPEQHGCYDLFLHGWDERWIRIAWWARRIYASNESIAAKVKRLRPSVKTVLPAWCPSTVDGDPSTGDPVVLAFGMAHKLTTTAPHYTKLRDLLADYPKYAVMLSTMVHDGNPWEETLHAAECRAKAIFGDHTRLLGALADDALSREIYLSDAAALFYEPAVRSNNTTLWAAMERGCPVITNLDEQSPKELVHGKTVFDIHQLDAWPSQMAMSAVSQGGRGVAEQYSWDRLVDLLR